MVNTLQAGPLNAAGSNALHVHLNAAGWSSLTNAQGLMFRLAHGRTESQLTLSHQTSAWVRVELHSPSLAPPKSGDDYLNDGLPGMMKLVGSSSGKFQFVTDVPSQLLQADAERDYDYAGGAIESPLGLSVAALTSIARGDELPPGEPIDWPATLSAVEAAGWTASRDGDGIKITVAQPGQFYEIAVSADHPCGLRVSAELSALDAHSIAEHEATLLLVCEANERLQLARMRYVDGSPARFVAEVRLSLRVVSNVWLLAALDAVYAAIVLFARPLAALRGPRLAESVLAAHTK